MKIMKKTLLILMLMGIGLVDIMVYRGHYFYGRSDKTSREPEKVALLQEGIRYFTLNDRVYYELGKAYFNLGMQELSDPAAAQEFFRNSMDAFRQSLNLNPASQYAHYNLALTLQYWSLLDPYIPLDPLDEYWKASQLVGENNEIYFEVGKIFLARWNLLSDQEKNLAFDILRSIMVRRDLGRITALLNIWEMNVRDYTVINRIMPEDALIYRVYARFLGQKSMSLEERWRYQIKADILDYKDAEAEFLAGENAVLYYRMEEAFERFSSCLMLLDDLKLYQNLLPEKPIDPKAYLELKKNTYLNLIKAGLQSGKTVSGIRDYFQGYLQLENRVVTLNKLGDFLETQRFISGNLEENLRDLEAFSLILELYFKENRYRDIIRVGNLFRESYLVIPDGGERAYVNVLRTIGDANLKADFVYEAKEFYQKALDADPDNLDLLLSLVRNYERLNDEEKIAEIRRKIAVVRTDPVMTFQNFTIKKSHSFTKPLVLDGRDIELELLFEERTDKPGPLLSVLFNERMVWEGYRDGPRLSLALETRPGENIFTFISVSRDVSPVRLTYRIKEGRDEDR